MNRWMMALPILWIATAACGGIESSSSAAGAALSDEEEEKGTADPSDPGDPQAGCAESGFTCTTIVDKWQLCAADQGAHWELACGDNEVCCGTPIEEDPGTDPGTEKPGDPGEPGDPGAANPSDPGEPGDPNEPGK